jgi:hypothetical protein
MKVFALSWFLFLFFSTSFPWLGGAITKLDVIAEMEKGDGRVILGALKGEIDWIRQGFREGGSVKAELTREWASVILSETLDAWKDFPLGTALHLALDGASRKQVEAVFFMLRHGADPAAFRLPGESDGESFPPAIYFAFGYGSRAAGAEHASMVQHLFDKGSHFLNLSHTEAYEAATGAPPLLHLAVQNGNFEGAMVLLDDLGADIEVRDLDGYTSLHRAAFFGQLPLLVLLMDRGADVLARGADGRTAAHLAIIAGHDECLVALLEAPHFSHAEASGRIAAFLRHTDAAGLSPLQYAHTRPAPNPTVEGLSLLLDAFPFPGGTTPTTTATTTTATASRDRSRSIGASISTAAARSESLPARRLRAEAFREAQGWRGGGGTDCPSDLSAVKVSRRSGGAQAGNQGGGEEEREKGSVRTGPETVPSHLLPELLLHWSLEAEKSSSSSSEGANMNAFFRRDFRERLRPLHLRGNVTAFSPAAVAALWPVASSKTGLLERFGALPCFRVDPGSAVGWGPWPSDPLLPPR